MSSSHHQKNNKTELEGESEATASNGLDAGVIGIGQEKDDDEEEEEEEEVEDFQDASQQIENLVKSMKHQSTVGELPTFGNNNNTLTTSPTIMTGAAGRRRSTVTITSQPGKDGQEHRRATIQLNSMVAFDVDIPPELVQDPSGMDLLEDDEFLQAKPQDGHVALWYPTRQITTNTCRYCCGMCGLWFLSFLLLVVLSFAVEPIEFDIGVPFYDRSEINEQREDAYLATARDADFVATFGQEGGDGSSTLCVHAAPTILTRNGTLLQDPAPSPNCQRASSSSLRVLYVAKDRTSNILTSKNLQQIQAIEQELLSHQDLTKYCQLIGTNHSAFNTRNREEILATLERTANATEANHLACARINSALNFMDDLYFIPEFGFGYHLMPSDVIPQQYDLNQSSIDNVIDFWSNYETTSYDMTAFPAAVSTVGSSITLPNLFLGVTSTDFTAGSTEAIGLISDYPLGLPLNGYATSSQTTGDQYKDTGTWLWEEYDSFLKGASFEGVDVYFSDTELQMRDAETGYLATQSFLLFPFSILFVFLYLCYMQDSIYIAAAGIMQIILCFIPSLILYRYVFGITYLGVLNVISFYIILGIGVDDIFVFCDQWNHNSHEKNFGQRLQKTFNVASRAMFTTSCTTFISFISNAGSVFPAVRCFGIFSALLVLVNFCAVCLFWPAAYGVYFRYVRHRWYDHPSRLCCFGFCRNKEPWTQDTLDVELNYGTAVADAINKTNNSTGEDRSGASVNASSKDLVEDDAGGAQRSSAVSNAGSKVNVAIDAGAKDGEHESSSKLVIFFRDTWAPFMIKLRYMIVVVFAGIFVGAMIIASKLEPDEKAPSTLPDNNQYMEYIDITTEYFARKGDPLAINVLWVSGINPDDPIDRTGTDSTNITDYGTANYEDCSVFDPTTMAAQVWNLQTCHDMFFGNVTEYHGDSADFGLEGPYGPRERKLQTERVPNTEEWYYQLVTCPYQGFRDWLLTDQGCAALQNYSLPCYAETSQRENCVTWDTEGHSCEPFPVEAAHYGDLFIAWLFDPNVDPATLQTNYDKYFELLFVAEGGKTGDQENDEKILQQDFSCRTTSDGHVLVALSSTCTLDQGLEQNYEDGIDLFDRWDAWSRQMLAFAPREMAATMQTCDLAWSYYFLNETLINETYSSIGLALLLSFIILSLVGGNVIMAFYSVFTIFLIVLDVFAFTVIMGWKLGILEAVNYVVVIGLSIDYTVHLSEAYTESHARDRRSRTIHMVEEMGVSVLSGAISTLGSVFFMFFAPNTFFVKFATFIFATITLSCIYALVFFPAVLSIVGPTGDWGNFCFWGAKRWRQFKHVWTREYMDTEEFKRRELAHLVHTGEIETLVEC